MLFAIFYPILGLMVVFLWTMSACNLVNGLVFYKYKKRCMIELIGLYAVNAFYLPTLVQYVWLESVIINGIFYFINVLFLVYTFVNYKGKLKFPYIYLICTGLIPILSAVIPDADLKTFEGIMLLWIMYTLLTVVLLPVAYYMKIVSNPVPEEVMKHINRSKGIRLPYPNSQVYAMTCGGCGAVIVPEQAFCIGCGSPNTTLENANKKNYPKEDVALDSNHE